jgi:signal transduction histidine kinase
VTRASRLVAVVLLALVAVAAACLVRPWFAPTAALAIHAAVAAGGLCVAVLAIDRYRRARDPYDVFAGVGLAVLALHEAALGAGGQWLPQVIAGRGGEGPQLPSDPVANAWLLGGWAVAGLCVAAAIRSRDRRGRPPTRPATVVAAAVAGSIAVGLLAFVQSDANFPGYSLDLRAPHEWGEPRFWPGGRWWIPTAIAAAAWAAATLRQAVRNSDPRATWFAVAGALSIGVVLGSAAWPTSAYGWATPAELLSFLVVAAALQAELVSGRAEATRMRRATDRAAAITEGRAEIASMIAHELRGPVTTVKGLATTGARHADSLSDAEKTEFFELIDQESRRLLHIVDETSTALKVDAGTITYDVRPENLAVVVADGADRAGHDGHPLSVEAEPDVVVPLDRLRITQTVTQIVENAANFSPAGEPIVVRARREGGLAVIEVLDRGPGIAAEDRERAFERFAHLRPRGYEEVPGSGLGLFICRAHVLAHGGTISIEGHPQEGTMLRICLPMEGNG